MAREFPTSASQDRMLALFGLTCDGTTLHAQSVLAAAGLPANGIPAGLTPQKAKKLADADLISMFPQAAATDTAAVEAAAAAEVARERAERNARTPDWSTGSYLRRRKELTREREAQNSKLRAAGYSWQRPYSGEGVDRYDADDAGWELVAPNGEAVTVREAMAAIGA